MSRQSLYWKGMRRFIYPILVSAVFVFASNRASALGAFLPVLICSQGDAYRSLALSESKNFRGLKFDESLWKNKIAPNRISDALIETLLSVVAPLSRARAAHFAARFESMKTDIKFPSTVNFLSNVNFDEISTPASCRIETMGVVSFDPRGKKILKVYLNSDLWNQLDGLEQAATLLEIFLLEELGLTPGASLGSRAFGGYLLAVDSPLTDPKLSFEIQQRIGLQFFDMTTPKLCVRMDRPVKWHQSQIVEGTAFSDFLHYDECTAEVRGQALVANGTFALWEAPLDPALPFRSVSLNSPGYLDPTLTKIYGKETRFRGSSSWDGAIEFFETGKLRYGELQGQMFFDLPRTKLTTKNASTKMLFWPNGSPRRINHSMGQVFVAGEWHDVESQDVLLYASGALACSDFVPGRAHLSTKNGRPYALNQNNRFVCFEESGNVIEETHTSAHTSIREHGATYPSEEIR